MTGRGDFDVAEVSDGRPGDAVHPHRFHNLIPQRTAVGDFLDNPAGTVVDPHHSAVVGDNFLARVPKLNTVRRLKEFAVRQLDWLTVHLLNFRFLYPTPIRFREHAQAAQIVPILPRLLLLRSTAPALHDRAPAMRSPIFAVASRSASSNRCTYRCVVFGDE